LEDKDLIELIRKDNRHFGVLFERYYPVIKKYILKRILDYDVASDIAAETFLKAFLNIEKFEWRNVPLSAWLYRIANNEVNQYFRKRSYSPVRFMELIDFNRLDKKAFYSEEEEKENWERELKDHRDFIRVQMIIASLPEKYQEVLALRYFESKPVKEVAEILGKNEGTVKSLLSRGIEKVKNVL
jgi:RNA polymerase sigma-70 factor (ECF subfamily)